MNSTKKQLVSGVAYTALSKYSGILIMLVISGILARLIDAESFGVVALATVLILFFSMLSDMGVAPAIIQNKELTDKDISSIFSFTVWTGAFLAVCFFFASWGIAAFYDSPTLAPICRVLSLSIFLSSIMTVPNAQLYRDKQFKFIAVRTVSVQLITGIIAIIAAKLGAGIYALVIQPIFSNFIIFILTIKKYPQKLQFSLGLESVRKIFSYSAYQFLFNFINYFSRNFDKLILGKFLGMKELGYYDKSYRLMMIPLQNITHVLTPVMHPIFSDLQNELKELTRSYLKIVRLMALIGFPVSVVLVFCSRELMLLIFGMQWEPSVPVFEILSFSVGIQIVMSTSGSIFQASGDTKTLFISGLISTILNLSGMIISLAVFKTAEALAWSIVVTFTINFVICYMLMFMRTLDQPMGQFWKQLISPFILSALIFAVLYMLSAFTEDMNLMLSLIIKSGASVAIWVVYIQVSGEYDLISHASKIMDKIKNR